ncbi:MAG: transcription elongation factor NusA [Nitrososphaerales archaeon]
MRLPICSFDAKTGILCPKCEGKFKSGHLTKTDVDLSIKLSKLQDKIPELDKSTLLHALEVDGDLALVMGKGDHDILRKNHAVFRRMENETGRKIWIVEGETSDRKVLEDIFFPIKILMVNVVWLPDGSKLTKVIVPGRKTRRFPLDLEQVKNVVKAVRGIDLLIEFEKS